jgi:hypothetical protein
MLGARRKERELRLYQETMDIRTVLKLRAGSRSTASCGERHEER